MNGNMMNTTQHGFLPGRSTTTNLIEYLNAITSEIDQRNTVCAIYTDFSKCFDRIPHDLLLHKLSNRYNVKGHLLNWIKDWLSERKQRVILNGEESGFVDVTSGVIQGSTLGPILAVMMLDTIDDELEHGQASKYADDNKVYGIVMNAEDQRKMQDDLNRIGAWAQQWGFDLNAGKCSVVQYGATRNGHSRSTVFH